MPHATRRAVAKAAALLVFAVPARAGAQTPSSAPADTSLHAGRSHDAAMWAGAGAALVGAALLDRTIAAEIPDGGGKRWEWASDRLNYGGRPQWAAVALAATWAGGRLAGSRETSRAAEHVGAALLASGVMNGAFKFGVGRERPSFTGDPHRFRPMNRADRWQSFPSGHATVAFSLAASISEEARRPWVTAATYTGATLVGWSRVYEDRHWASDVVGGAIIGVAASRYTLHRLHARRSSTGTTETSPTVTLSPLPGGAMIRITH